MNVIEGLNQSWIKYFLIVGVTLLISVVVILILRRVLSIFINKYARRLNADPTNFSFIKSSIGFIVITFALIFIFYKIPFLSSIGKAMFAGAGVIAAIIGFAAQKAFANIISGVFILIFKPFRISDVIEITAGQKGIVEEITLRHTVIREFENRRIIIPNSTISDATIINSNFNDEKIRKHILFSISYTSDINKAIQIIQRIATEHPLLLDNRTDEERRNNDPVVLVRVVALSNFSVDLKAYVWAKNNSEAFILSCDLLKSVKEAFDHEGIEIPFPYQNVILKNNH